MRRLRQRKAASAVGLVLVLASAARAAPAADPGGRAAIVEEAVERLPEPLRGFFQAPGALDRLTEATAGARDGSPRAAAEAAESSARGTRCVFHLDALAPDFAAPFADLPRDRDELARRIGAERLEKDVGTGPWRAVERYEALAEAMADAPDDAVFRRAGELAACIIDLHMPLNTSARYGTSAGDGTGGMPGIQAALQVGLLVRYGEFYEAELAKGRRTMRYVEDPLASVFAWTIGAHTRVAPLVGAASAARDAAGYDPGDPANRADLADPDAPEARGYYARLKEALAVRGAPVAAARREAAAHLADLLYSAYVLSGKRLGLPPEPEPEGPSATSYWLLAVGMAMLAFLLLSRRRRRGEAEKGDGE
jgi:MYXO-CTERM domain-containing protein